MSSFGFRSVKRRFFCVPKREKRGTTNHAHIIARISFLQKKTCFSSLLLLSLDDVRFYLQPKNVTRSLVVAGDEVRLDGEHFCGDGGGEGIDLAGVLFDLTAVDESLES